MHICVLMLAILMLAPTSSAIAQDSRIRTGASFYEDFLSLDRRRWFISNGWSNGPHQNCTWSTANVRRTKSALLMVLNHRKGLDRPYSCAELQTQDFYRFGTFEARLQPAAGPGTISAFFVYTRPTSSAGSTPEQISFNFLGKDQKVVLLTYSAEGLGMHRRRVELDFAPSVTMADYAFQWTPTLLRWYVNRQLVHEATQDPKAQFPSRAAKLYLSIRNGVGQAEEAWLGRFEYEGRPLVTRFEYVAFTELGTPCQFQSSVVCGERR